ncbi:MAG: hypothetical protein KKB51_09495 [Candidatus Riflebacteria bacterium]|nr:hypothetical protein [Candidatus Riflebacteria bacterium]
MRSYLLVILGMILFAGNAVHGDNTSVLVKGQWGKAGDQIGIRFPSPGVMPLAPYECLGGYDVDADGNLWITDSINHMIKRYKDKKWSYLMTSFDKTGDISFFNHRLYIVTRAPDGVAIINTENGKVEQQLRIDFKNPGRIKVFEPDLIGVEEPGVGLWICRKGVAELHPAAALEAAGSNKSLYGLQYNLEAESRSIIKAEFAEQHQEPETLALFEAGESIVYCKIVGMLKDQPMFMIVTQSKPGIMIFYALDAALQSVKKAELPIFDAPFLTSNWKLCSDGRLYGFEGHAKDGFKVHRYDGKL